MNNAAANSDNGLPTREKKKKKSLRKRESKPTMSTKAISFSRRCLSLSVYAISKCFKSEISEKLEIGLGLGMSDYLSEEVVLEILHRLPVKSLLRFRCVSKSWNSLITTPSFINSHLSYNSSNSNKLIVRYCVYPFVEAYKLIDDTIDSSSDQIQHIDFPLTSGGRDHFLLIGSVNGLFCLYELERYVIWNPSIRKFITLPKPCITVKTLSHNGFGFDPRTNDYKVVRILFLFYVMILLRTL